jgi:hypothetical protein
MTKALLSVLRQEIRDPDEALGLFAELPESMQRRAFHVSTGPSACLEAIHRAARQEPHAALAAAMGGLQEGLREVEREIARLSASEATLAQIDRLVERGQDATRPSTPARLPEQ